jgi:hypothetical protein
MSIILYLGRDVKEYKENSEEMIKQLIAEGKILCDICTQEMKRHSSYIRGKRETGEKIKVIFVMCGNCKHGHALLPDFILPYKQYSANEIEGVIIESKYIPIDQIETAASESTARRWITCVCNRIERAVSILKRIFMELNKIVSEIRLDAGFCYDELEQLLEMAPGSVKNCGNKLGLANLWLGRHNRRSCIC